MAPDCSGNTTGLAFEATQEFIIHYFCVFYSVCDTIQGTLHEHFMEITLTSSFHWNFCTNISHREHYYWIVPGSLLMWTFSGAHAKNTRL